MTNAEARMTNTKPQCNLPASFFVISYSFVILKFVIRHFPRYAS
jgi:hypothetical protein